jgi:hypothetical protein
MQQADFTQNFAPTFIRHTNAWNDSFSGKQQVKLNCRQNVTWITSTWFLQGNDILHNASACNVIGQIFQLYPATEGHSVSPIEYRDDLRALHIEPVAYQEARVLRDPSHPDLSKLESIAQTSELYKHRELDSTLAVHATKEETL